MSAAPTLFDADELSEPPFEPLVRVRLTVAYDGTPFHGFAVSAGVPTVAGSLSEALQRILRHPVDLACAGRTDKGVHARGQVVDFVTTEGVDLDALVRSVNMLCRPAIAVRDAALVPMAFSSRFDAISRRYRYSVLADPVPDPFLVDSAWQVRHPLDLALLRLACDPFIGLHDFSAFCRKRELPDGTEATLVRNIHWARWEDHGEGHLEFWIEASSFCHNMVRALVGTMVEVGRGRFRAGELRAMLESRDRARTGPVAPAHGLTLWEVGYPEPT